MPRSCSGNLELLVIQATPFCNLDCSYCYLPNRDSRHRMPEETLRATFRRVFDSPYVGPRLTVVWHSGEPLVLPLDFYRRGFAIADAMRPEELELVHSFQTNGTLISKEWVTFIRQSRARVGVSLDGPAELHDRRRRTRSGGPTFDRVINGIRILQDGGVPFHVITVLTRETIRQPDRLYDFYRDHGIDRVCFNIEEIEGCNATSSLAAPEVRVEFRDFLDRFLLRVKREGPRAPWVREFETAAASILRPAGQIGNQQATPFAIVSVDVDGNVSTFSPELLGMKSAAYDDFIIGNVHTTSLSHMAQTLSLQRMQRDIEMGVERCRGTCQYFGLCGGGTPVNKLAENGSFDSTETMLCRLTKMAVVDVVLADIEETLSAKAVSVP